MFVLNNKLKWNEKMNAAIGFNIYFVFAWKFHGYFDFDELSFERWFIYINYKKVQTILISDKIASENKIVRNFCSPKILLAQFTNDLWLIFRNHGIFTFPRLC